MDRNASSSLLEASTDDEIKIRKKDIRKSKFKRPTIKSKLQNRTTRVPMVEIYNLRESSDGGVSSDTCGPKADTKKRRAVTDQHDQHDQHETVLVESDDEIDDHLLGSMARWWQTAWPSEAVKVTHIETPTKVRHQKLSEYQSY